MELEKKGDILTDIHKEKNCNLVIIKTRMCCRNIFLINSYQVAIKKKSICRKKIYRNSKGKKNILELQINIE